MMEIIEVKQNWSDDLFRVDLTLGNFCNYRCWYCWPHCHSGTDKWPDFDIFTKNLSHLLDYYLNNTEKKRFDFHIMGGEITHWPRFFDLIEYCKNNYDCVFTLTTNASKDLEFWNRAAPYLDYVNMSVHHQFCDPQHITNVADLLYEKNVIITAVVLMDPMEWNKCMGIIEKLKKSKHKWAIRYLEIIHDLASYTDEQKKVLSKVRARSANLFWFFKNNKSYRSRVKIVDIDGKTRKVGDDAIILNRMNNFKGWDCSVGVNWIAVKTDGTVSAICGNGLYEQGKTYNIFKENFVGEFKPKIESTICQKDACWCLFEANMPKKKVIPIYES